MNSNIHCAMVIGILNDTHGLPTTSTSEHTLQYNPDHNVENISFKYIMSNISWISNSPLLLKVCHVHLS